MSNFVAIDKPFSLDPNIDTNTFVSLGEKKGRHYFALLHTKPLELTGLRILEDTIKKHSSDCVQYLILASDDRVVGSFFDSNRLKVTIHRNRVILIDSDLVEPFVNSPESFGGTFVFSDSEDSFLILPENPDVNKYMVI